MSRVLPWSRSHGESGRERDTTGQGHRSDNSCCEPTESFGTLLRSCAVTAEQANQPWQDPALPVTDRVELLLAEMTVEEKVAQLGSRWVGNDMQDSGSEELYTDPEE